MEFQDKTLNCVDCGTEFLWTAGEQLFFRRQEFQERTETVQELQGQARVPPRRRCKRRP